MGIVVGLRLLDRAFISITALFWPLFSFRFLVGSVDRSSIDSSSNRIRSRNVEDHAATQRRSSAVRSNDAKVQLQDIGQRGHSFRATGVLADNDSPLPVLDVDADPSCYQKLRSEIVHGLAKEAFHRGCLDASAKAIASSFRMHTCRSTVMIWFTPATDSRFASILAVIAPLCDFFLDCLE